MAKSSKTQGNKLSKGAHAGAATLDGTGRAVPVPTKSTVDALPPDLSEGPWHVAVEGGEPELKGESIVHESLEKRLAEGRARRNVCARETHAAWTPSPDRRSPLDILGEGDAGRMKDLVPLRYGRMSVSPFTFYRGAAAIMAADLAGTPISGMYVQLCGDCHLNNFGLYASPERRLLFDINDFDETLPGPWEWDVKRLVTSFVVGCRSTQFTPAQGREAAIRVCTSYRTRMAEYAEMGNIEVWYSRVDAEDVFNQLSNRAMQRRVEEAYAKARSKDRLAAFSKLTELANGHRQFKNDPPVLIRIATADLNERMHRRLRDYGRTLQHERRLLLEQYVPVDVARKVVGVGSVGTRCLVILLEGRDVDDPLFLQIKEAGPSVLEGYLPKSKYRNHGQRVVVGQRQMQAASDVFLGWIRGDDARDYYLRQLQDMKGAADLAKMRPEGLMLYADVCGWALARAHARSGDRVQIASYLGQSKKFDRAMADFAEVYADQNERDYDVLMKAIRSGEVPIIREQ
jgi:uncharacterized protein (DUF2252 family)